ncbi:MAG: hypothetical protein FJZ78_11315 [Bacteroidetes bacterium]|nr:hypothetical protein [Bacteroidota bacterium]
MKNRQYVKAERFLKRDQEKSYLVEARRPQEENMTQLKESKKPKGKFLKRKSKLK